MASAFVNGVVIGFPQAIRKDDAALGAGLCHRGHKDTVTQHKLVFDVGKALVGEVVFKRSYDRLSFIRRQAV